MKVLHLSWRKRRDGELGGVEKFAALLQRGLQEEGHECQVVSWRDFPKARQCASAPNPDKALMLGSWADTDLDFDIAVSDGYWGAGIATRKVVPVIHGTWAQFHINMGGSPWTNMEVKAQHEAFNAVNAFPVGCSWAASRELLAHHRVRAATTILHGIDLEEFRPQKHAGDGPPIVLHAASNAKKGAKMMPAVARLLHPDFRVLYLDAKAGGEAAAFQRGDIFFHPARHEGNAYALLEAMATGLPIVTTPVGLFESIDDGLVGRSLFLSTSVPQWAQAIREVWGDGTTPYRHYAKGARATAQKMCDFNTFKREWCSFLEGLL